MGLPAIPDPPAKQLRIKSSVNLSSTVCTLSSAKNIGPGLVAAQCWLQYSWVTCITRRVLSQLNYCNVKKTNSELLLFDIGVFHILFPRSSYLERMVSLSNCPYLQEVSFYFQDSLPHAVPTFLSLFLSFEDALWNRCPCAFLELSLPLQALWEINFRLWCNCMSGSCT